VRERTRKDRLLVGLLIAFALCAGLTVLHHQRQHVHRADPVVGAIRDRALVPPQRVILNTSRWWRRSVAALWQGPRLARANDFLQAQVLALEAQNKDLLAAQAENAALRAQLGFEKRSPLPLLPAEVTALKPTPQMDTLTLDRGSGNGIKLQSVVLSPNGSLVGQVVDVTPGSCNVLMLTDNNSSVGAEVVHTGTSEPRIGICRGDRTQGLVLTVSRLDAGIKPGDQIVTSGLGTIFPQGLPIGVVKSVTTDRTLAVQRAILRPDADFNHLEEAFLVR
jgi:rod shape-determining protein MreC